jgi:tRNA uridine 5-carboxymethylaminomethyl modification enzyme
MRDFYDVIVIGGGHAGTEATWAAANVLGGGRVAMVTMDPSKIGAMSCNPAIGGLAKGQIVREIDAMGGLMGLAADATGIQFRMLNMSRGAAVRGPRAQCDKYAYAAEVQRLIASHPSIDVIAATVDDLVVENGRIVGVRVPNGARVVVPDAAAMEWNLANRGLARSVFARVDQLLSGDGVLLRAGSVVLTTGTFMRALMHTGECRSEGGRVGEGSAVGISACLHSLGFELGRLKTGTPPRLAAESIAWDEVDPQPGDASPTPFSDRSPDALPSGRFPHLPQVECFATETTSEAHDLIRANIHRAPMYSGAIEADCGPRYCPSIEDKVVRFADRQSHHVFLEPESLHTNEVYCNGISTSLPADVQEVIVRSMRGCAGARVLKWGYAVEYDMVWPHQIDATGMTRRVPGLFLAGQINGTSGYEEAAGQGLVAGVNAARFARSVDPVVIRRDQGYLGVMMDDLVTKTPREPYRMFTSRAEHRILLRADNADERLTPLARDLGLIDDDHWRAFADCQRTLRDTRERIAQARIDGKRGDDYIRRPEVTLDDVARLLNGAAPPRSILSRAMHDIQYEAYLDRQRAEVRRLERAEQHRIPADLDYSIIPGLRAETREALDRFRPATLGQAGRIAGVNPTDLTILAVAIRRHGTRDTANRAAPPA